MKKLINSVIPEIDLENPLGDFVFKIEISPYKQIEEHFEDYKELFSLKIRPITEFYSGNNKKFENAWYHQNNWRDIDNYLKQNFSHEKTGDVSRGFMDIYSFQGINFASVLFDTGPEIIFDLSSFTPDSEFNEQIINFIRVILSTLENNNCKAISYELRAITTGEKEKFEKTIIQISEYPILNVESTIADIEELINKTLCHTQYKKLTRKW